jgi:hypothetical protein
MSVTAEQAVHGLATRMGMPARVRSLEDVLGQRLVAVVAGVADAKAVGKWARARRGDAPRCPAGERHGQGGSPASTRCAS